MAKVLLSTALKNRFKKVGNFEYYLKNIRLNGVSKGCSGFIKNPVNGKIVYLTTEKSCYQTLANKSMYRTAVSLSDYRGGRNQFCLDDDLVRCVVRELQ